MFSELLERESRFPPLLGVGLAAVMMGAVAVASAQASLPTHRERLAAASVPTPALKAEVAAHVATPKFVFGHPLAGFAVNSPFGLRRMPWEAGGRLHEGVDIAAPAGTPVRATLAGVVVRSGVDGGYGRYVEVEHEGGLTSLYAHLGRFAGLKAGAAVPAGAVLGYVGNSGRSTGSHLHFEIRQDDRPLNPVAFLGRSFMTEADLPLKLASYIPRKVRIAQVAEWPSDLMRKKREKETAVVAARVQADGRVRATITPSTPANGPRTITVVTRGPLAVPQQPAAAASAPIAPAAPQAASDASAIITTAPKS